MNFTFKKLSEVQLKAMHNRLVQHTPFVPELPDLRERLLAIEGLELVPPMGECPKHNPELKRLVEELLYRGELEVPENVVLTYGKTAEALKIQRPALSLMCGFALSEDGLWRYHRWLLEPRVSWYASRVLLEPTVTRLMYYGIKLR